MNIKIKILGDAYAYQVPLGGWGGGYCFWAEGKVLHRFLVRGLGLEEIVHVLWLIYDFIFYSFSFILFLSCSPLSALSSR